MKKSFPIYVNEGRRIVPESALMKCSIYNRLTAYIKIIAVLLNKHYDN